MDLFTGIAATVGLFIAWGSWRIATFEYEQEMAWIEAE